jgi:hypothetical protein
MAEGLGIRTGQRVEIELVTAVGCGPIEIQRSPRSVYGEDFKDVSSLKFCVYFVKSGEKI